MVGSRRCRRSRNLGRRLARVDPQRRCILSDDRTRSSYPESLRDRAHGLTAQRDGHGGNRRGDQRGHGLRNPLRRSTNWRQAPPVFHVKRHTHAKKGFRSGRRLHSNRYLDSNRGKTGLDSRVRGFQPLVAAGYERRRFVGRAAEGAEGTHRGRRLGSKVYQIDARLPAIILVERNPSTRAAERACNAQTNPIGKKVVVKCARSTTSSAGCTKMRAHGGNCAPVSGAPARRWYCRRTTRA